MSYQELLTSFSVSSTLPRDYLPEKHSNYFILLLKNFIWLLWFKLSFGWSNPIQPHNFYKTSMKTEKKKEKENEKGKRKRKQASILNNFQQVFLHHVQLSVTLSPADHGGSEDPPVSSVSWTSVVTGHAVLGVAFLFLKKASLIADL